MSQQPFVPVDFEPLAEEAMRHKAGDLLNKLRRRRSVRKFSSRSIPLDVVRCAIESAAQAPSGANKQPWTFVLVTDPAIKRRIREAAEETERAFYEHAPESWLRDLEPLGTTWEKAFLEEAPALIVVFAQTSDSDRKKHYYVKESVGIAAGFLVAVLHLCGLATLTHTPNPMGFLAKILDRPSWERPYLLIPVGYPHEACRAPAIERKPLSQVLIEF